MAKLHFVEETLRDGQQSLWANRMTTASMLPACPMLDGAGFNKINIMSASAFESCLVYLYENPWERMRLLCQSMPKTDITILIRSRHCFGWDRYPNDVIELHFKCLRDLGVRWLLIFDGLNDIRNLEWQFRIGRSLGIRVTGVLTFAESPVHTDEYYAQKAKEVINVGVDSVLMADASGLLTPDRTSRLVPAIRSAIGENVALEFVAHCGTGMGSACVLEAVKGGANIISTAALPLSYGNSIPSTSEMMYHAKELGLEVDLNEDLVRRIDDYFFWVAYGEKRPPGRPVKFDPVEYKTYAGHQIPGGMMSHLVSQLKDLGLEHRLPEVLEEAARVREEIGHPVMVTPFSQFVGVQAVFNVIAEERYSTVPQGLKEYARGGYGRPAAPIEANVLDRILADGDEEPIDPLENMMEPTVSRVRSEKGPFRSDEELLLSIFNTPQTIAKFHKNRKALEIPVLRQPLAALVKELTRRKDIKKFFLRKNNVRLEQTF
jgi:oxaloacetate decarboxylase alpha subunit